MAIANYSKQFTVTAFTKGTRSGPPKEKLQAEKLWNWKVTFQCESWTAAQETGRDLQVGAAGTAARIEHKQLLLKQLFFSCSF